MYIDNATIAVLRTAYDAKDKKKTINSHDFHFNDGLQAKDLARFLENLSENYRYEGTVMVSVTIDTRDHD
jgi:hypothetical protein